MANSWRRSNCGVTPKLNSPASAPAAAAQSRQNATQARTLSRDMQMS